MPTHWTSRPEEPKELSVGKISMKLCKGEPLYCGKCGDKLKVTITHVINCRKCHPKPGESGTIGAFRIVDKKILFDAFNGKYIPGKHVLFDPIAAKRHEKGLQKEL